MVISEDIQKEIEVKAELYEAAEVNIKARIEKNIDDAKEKLEEVKKELLNETESEFAANPFAEFLSNEYTYTDTDARIFLTKQEIPENFGPDENSLSTLLKDIDSFRAWRDKPKPLDLVPKDLKVGNVTYDSISLSWSAINSDCIYKIELKPPTSPRITHYTDKLEDAFYNLKPGTEYHIRVRAVFLRKDVKCRWSDPFTVKTKNLFARDVVVKAASWCEIEVSWEVYDEEKRSDNEIRYTVEMRKEGERHWNEIKSGLTDKMSRVGGLMDDSAYEVRVRCFVKGGSLVSEWSDVARGRTLKWDCAWKECPDIDEDKKYSVDTNNPRIVTKVNGCAYCTIISNTHVPLNTVTSWSIKLLKSENNNGSDILIGITTNDINQDDVNCDKRGWHFYCYSSKLCSGPPQNYSYKEYGPRKGPGEYVHTGDSVGLVMDTIKGDLSFVLNGVNLGVAYEGIPLDKPLVPCVILKNEGDSVEFDPSEVKVNLDSSVHVLSKITAKSITWDTITLTWDKVADASFYQIEVDGSKSWESSTTNMFTKGGFLPTTKHSFRVRTVKGSSVSEWSGIARGRTLKKSFKTSGWKECPDDVICKRKYSINEKNSRIATKVNNSGYYSTIIGNTPVPFNTATSWSIIIFKSKKNNGNGIYIGVAPSDINQNNDDNYNKCGWYFYCGDSTLCSGPPHNYSDKEYGPRKRPGEYVREGDSVGVLLDTEKGDLSFVLSGVNRGVAYKGIPLDKPLVPCVLLKNEDDSVEFDTSGVKESSKGPCDAFIKLSFFFFLLAIALSIISRHQERW